MGRGELCLHTVCRHTEGGEAVALMKMHSLVAVSIVRQKHRVKGLLRPPIVSAMWSGLDLGETSSTSVRDVSQFGGKESESMTVLKVHQ